MLRSLAEYLLLASKTISNFFKMREIKKELTPDQIDDMHEKIERHGFNLGFEHFMDKYNYYKKKDTRKKESLMDQYIYEQKIREQQAEKASGEIEKPKPPRITLSDVEGRPIMYSSDDGNGTTLKVYVYIFPWNVSVVKSPNLERPQVLIGSNVKKVITESIKIYNKCKQESGNKLNQKQRKNTIEKSDVDISHVKRAMGLEQNNRNDNLDDILKDLF